jgi:ABC-type bacteriocin/lantibiotic exporter with double-glycine peptidase domain
VSDESLNTSSTMPPGELIRGLLTVFQGRDRQKALALLILIVASSVLETVGVASIGPFLAVISAPETIEKSWSINALYHALGAADIRTFQIYVGLLTAATVLVGNVVASLTVWLIARFTFGQGFKLGCRLLGTYLGQPYAFFLEHNTVDLARNVYDEVPRAVSGVILPMFYILARSLSIVLIVSLLIYMDKTIAFVVLLVFGGSYALLYKVLQRRSQGVREVVTEMRASSLRLASEALAGIKELKVLGSEASCVQMYSIPTSAVARADAQHQIYSTLPKYLLETVGFVGIVLIVLFQLMRGVPQLTTLPLVAVYAFAGYRLLPALQHLYTNLHFVQYFSASLKIVTSALNASVQQPKLDVRAPPAVPLSLKDSIALDRVSFRYPNGVTNVLDDISLRIKAKSVIGIVGATGSGKSTLLDLLLGLLVPSAGSIIIDGGRLDSGSVRPWQAAIGYVPQQIYLTDGTISENIALGQFRHEIDMRRVVLAAKSAHVEEFVHELPDGYESRIGERGVRLSGGQRQRIGIARALYRNPEVLIFDEATSALDNVTEAAVMETVKGLMGEKTIILVAHRLTTLRLCDQIFVLENGMISQHGTYEELLKRSDFFRDSHNSGHLAQSEVEEKVKQ